MRIKEEVTKALVAYAKPRGVTLQHVTSVGAWFYMCLPIRLTDLIGKAFYEWCQNGLHEASLPDDVDPLLKRIMSAIRKECAAEEKEQWGDDEISFDDFCGPDNSGRQRGVEDAELDEAENLSDGLQNLINSEDAASCLERKPQLGPRPGPAGRRVRKKGRGGSAA